jgi:hypothetical protein
MIIYIIAIPKIISRLCLSFRLLPFYLTFALEVPGMFEA